MGRPSDGDVVPGGVVCRVSGRFLLDTTVSEGKFASVGRLCVRSGSGAGSVIVMSVSSHSHESSGAGAAGATAPMWWRLTRPGSRKFPGTCRQKEEGKRRTCFSEEKPHV